MRGISISRVFFNCFFFRVLVFILEIHLFLWLDLSQDTFVYCFCILVILLLLLFVCFDIVNGVIFMIFLSAWFLFVHNKTSDFCILVLYSAKGIYMVLGVLVVYLETHI